MDLDNCKELLRDENLSLKAKGVAMYILSLAGRPGVSVKDIVSNSPDGWGATYKAVGELRSAGYLKSEHMTANGKFAGMSMDVRTSLSQPFVSLSKIKQE